MIHHFGLGSAAIYAPNLRETLLARPASADAISDFVAAGGL